MTSLHKLSECIKKEDILACGLIVAFYAVMEGIGITCPILFVTGVSCAGCGMSRAWLAAFRLDFPAAFGYHPLFWLPVPMIIIFLLRKKINKRIYHLLMAVMIAAFIAVYIIRLLNPEDDVVRIGMEDGVIYKIVKLFLNYIR